MQANHKSDVGSLVLPLNVDTSVFDEKNWRFTEARPTKPQAIVRIIIQCIAKGFENLVYEVEGAASDIERYCGGDDARFKQHVMAGFLSTIDKKRVAHQEQIARLAGLTIIKHGR